MIPRASNGSPFKVHLSAGKNLCKPSNLKSHFPIAGRARTHTSSHAAGSSFICVNDEMSQPSHPARSGGCDILARAARIVHLNKSRSLAAASHSWSHWVILQGNSSRQQGHCLLFSLLIRGRQAALSSSCTCNERCATGLLCVLCVLVCNNYSNYCLRSQLMHFPLAATLITFYLYYALRFQPLRFASLLGAWARKCDINLAGI
jgi:hypothetical protein